MALFCVRPNERRRLKAPRQLRLVRTLVTGRRCRFEVAESRDAPWLSRRMEEWVRRFGASLPNAHDCIMVRVLGPTGYKVVARLNRAPKAGSPLIVIATALSVPSCSKHEGKRCAALG